MLVTCFCTPRSEMSRRSAIPWFERPSAISSSTSRSRGVISSSGPASRRLESSWETIVESSAEPPPATRRIASAKSSRSATRSLSMYPMPSVPRSSSFIASSTSTCWESTITPTPGCSSRIFSAACRPSSVCVGGIRRSTIATSGPCSPTDSTSASPSSACATTSNPASVSSSATPSRSSIVSSARTTRIQGRQYRRIAARASLAPMLSERVAGLSLVVEEYALERLDAAGYERTTTQYRLRGGGEEGVGEDVGLFDEGAEALHDAGPYLDLAGEWTLAGFVEHLATVDQWMVAPPPWEMARAWRNWAFESAALDLALRQAGKTLREVLGIEPRPVRFVNSLGLGEPPSATGIARRFAQNPTV